MRNTNLMRYCATIDSCAGTGLTLGVQPLHRLDCCVIIDGGDAVRVTRPEIARNLGNPMIGIVGSGEAIKGQNGGDVNLIYSGTVWMG